MFHSMMAAPPRELLKWCAYALVLLTPGSFIVLPLVWWARHGMVRSAPLKALAVEECNDARKSIA